MVDVFTSVPLEGNPLAVFPEAAGLQPATMQAIAKELNLSETAFVLPTSREGCVRRVRIFTPTREMEFAGHPTIGTAFTLIRDGVVGPNSRHFVLGREGGSGADSGGTRSESHDLAADSFDSLGRHL